MHLPTSHDAVVVSETSFRSDDPAEIVESNISFLNTLFEEYFTAEEVSADALRSYYVDYYLSQMENGGFSQFVYNSRWSPLAVELVREGLRAMKAEQHLKVFDEGVRLVERFGRERLETYFDSEYFGENPDRDELNAPSDGFFRVSEQEDLLALNAAWLRQLPALVVMTTEEMREEVRHRVQSLPDRERRVAEARANEPRYMKLVRALCERAGHELLQVTAGDPTRVHEGAQTLAWHFITDKGHHHMIEAGGKAIMFRGHSLTERVCEVDAPGE